MTDDMVEFAAYSNTTAAEIVAGLLRSEGIDAHIRVDEPIPGLTRSIRLMVPAALLRKAQAAADEARLSEEELASIALAATPNDDDRPD
jgi:hypothetical protein